MICGSQNRPKRLNLMRPITNILLVLALICYVFLPFYDISLYGKVTGLAFTAGNISQSLTLGKVIIALLPFLACFAAITLNCLRSRWWILGTIVFILIWLWFYMDTSSIHEVMLQHSPEVTPDNDLGEGFKIEGLGIGYKLSSALTVLSLLSAIISLLPFKFNETIEKAVDDTFEDGRRHVRKEFNRLEYNLHKGHKSKASAGQHTQSPTPPPVEQEEAPTVEDKEDPTRFMPRE